MDTIKVLFDYVAIFFILYLLGYSTFLFLSVTVASSVLYKQYQQRQLYNELRHDYYVPVSIIVPAYNEEVTVVDTVLSLLQQNYKLYEIIVVDDGSMDSTAQVLIDYFNMQKIERPIHKQLKCQREKSIYMTQEQKISLTLIQKESGGKADALNMGINACQFPYYVCIDADSMLQGDALENIVRPVLEDSNIVACGGMVRIANEITIKDGKVVNYRLPKNPLVFMQIIEYDRSFLASRILLDQFNGNLIISGAFGLFRKDIVIAAGGYDSSTVGEDMELVVKLHVFCRSHNMPYSIRYAPDAICWSQAPGSIKDIKKQRKRWHYGLYQSVMKHKHLLTNSKYGQVSFFSFPYYLLYELFSPVIELFGILTIVMAFAVNLINVPFMIMFFLIYVIFGAVMSLTAFFTRLHTQEIRLSGGDAAKAVVMCLCENLGLRFIILWVRLTALIGYRKNEVEWGEIERFKMSI